MPASMRARMWRWLLNCSKQPFWYDVYTRKHFLSWRSTDLRQHRYQQVGLSLRRPHLAAVPVHGYALWLAATIWQTCIFPRVHWWWWLNVATVSSFPTDNWSWKKVTSCSPSHSRKLNKQLIKRFPPPSVLQSSSAYFCCPCWHRSSLQNKKATNKRSYSSITCGCTSVSWVASDAMQSGDSYLARPQNMNFDFVHNKKRDAFVNSMMALTSLQKEWC